jgi:HAD superfamily hydrolase (TIGR01509 family)
MALEIRTLPRAAFYHLASLGRIPLLDEGLLSEAEAVFRVARQEAEASGRETTHTEDLAAMVEALGLQRQVSPQDIQATVASLHRRCVGSTELIEATRETLLHLKDSGYLLGVISNAAYAPFLSWTLEHFKIASFFEDVVVSADVRARKPWPKIFHIALERLGLSPAQAAYVGDDFRKDIAASKRLGMRAIWYRPEGDPPRPDERAIPDAIVTSIDEIPQWAERWRDANGEGEA